jgi:hypothetical protein
MPLNVTSTVICRNPASASLAKMFLVEFPKLVNLTTRHSLEDVLVIRCALHQLVNFRYSALAIPLGQPLQKVGCDMVALVPLIPAGLPMRGLETRAKADPICNAEVQLRK